MKPRTSNRIPKISTHRYLPFIALAGLIVLGFLMGVSDPSVWGGKESTSSSGSSSGPHTITREEDQGGHRGGISSKPTTTTRPKNTLTEGPAEEEVQHDIAEAETSALELPSPPYAVAANSGGRSGVSDAANRSPPRLKPPLLLGGSAKLGEKQISNLGCWVKNGLPTSVPSFLPPLLSAMGGSVGTTAFDSMVREVSSDPWSILIGWIPSRFMPPQPKGKNARGEVMEAPTEGREAKLYHQVYNSTWQTAFQVDGKDWHFQLMHRNALRVCIRERLHLYEIFCGTQDGATSNGADGSTKSSSSLQIYYCPCRHCEKTVPRGLHKTKLKREGGMMGPTSLKAIAPIKAPSLASSGPESPGRSSGSCVSGRSAPWLVPPSTVEKFPFEGMHSPGQLGDLLQVQADTNNIVMVTFFNEFWIDHLHNWVYSLGVYGKAHNYIVATTDSKSLALCIKNRLPCFDATDFAEKKPEEKDGFKTKVTEAASWIKPRLAIAVLSRGFHFFMVDLDMTWNNAQGLHYILRTKSDISHQCDTPAKFSINSGYYLARSNDRTLAFFKNIMTFKPTENSDQTAMKLFMRYDTTHGASNECLDKWRFNMKCNFKVDKSVKLKGGVETFEWKAMEKDRSKFSWTIMHATCLSGAENKILWLRTMNAWFLDELDAVTNPLEIEGEKSVAYCLELDFPHLAALEEGEEVDHGGKKGVGAQLFKRVQQSVFQQGGSTTEHSRFYSRNATNSIFLKSRH